MDLNEIKTVINNYGKILEQEKKEAINFGIPESKLPYSKETIKEAIKYVLVNTPDIEKNMRNALENGYCSLADFIPDDNVEIEKRGIQENMSMDFVNRNQSLIDKSIKIQQGILDEQKNLLEEVKSYRQK